MWHVVFVQFVRRMICVIACNRSTGPVHMSSCRDVDLAARHQRTTCALFTRQRALAREQACSSCGLAPADSVKPCRASTKAQGCRVYVECSLFVFNLEAFAGRVGRRDVAARHFCCCIQKQRGARGAPVFSASTPRCSRLQVRFDTLASASVWYVSVQFACSCSIDSRHRPGTCTVAPSH